MRLHDSLQAEGQAREGWQHVVVTAGAVCIFPYKVVTLQEM